MPLPRMRTAKTAAQELRKLDPDTVFCERHIRHLMRSGKIPVVTSGRRQFINLDYLIEYLSKNDLPELSASQSGQIRRIDE